MPSFRLSSITSKLTRRKVSPVVPFTGGATFSPVAPTAPPSPPRATSSVFSNLNVVTDCEMAPAAPSSPPRATSSVFTNLSAAPKPAIKHCRRNSKSSSANTSCDDSQGSDAGSEREESVSARESCASDISVEEEEEVLRSTIKGGRGPRGAGAAHAGTWAIRLVPPPDEANDVELPLSTRFDGDWVLVNPQEEISHWLTALRVSGANVIDGDRVQIELDVGPNGYARLCGGELRRQGDRLYRLGKTGRMQEYRRRGQFLYV